MEEQINIPKLWKQFVCTSWSWKHTKNLSQFASSLLARNDTDLQNLIKLTRKEVENSYTSILWFGVIQIYSALTVNFSKLRRKLGGSQPNLLGENREIRGISWVNKGGWQRQRDKNVLLKMIYYMCKLRSIFMSAVSVLHFLNFVEIS